MITPNYRLARDIVSRGNEPGIIREWFAGMKAWAESNPGPDATALRLWLDIAKPRPFYTAAELASMWPALRIAHGYDKRATEKPSANRLANELEFHGVRYLAGAEGTYYFRSPFTGEAAKYFIVERPGYWRTKRLTQAEFEAALLGECE
jgi:hypothetical protein